jgi:hypothetical protein
MMNRHWKKLCFIGRIAPAVFRIASLQLTIGRWNAALRLLSMAKPRGLSADRVVFNISGNSYRLVFAIDYEKGIVWIKWLGTHKDYDQIEVTEVDYGAAAKPIA